MVKMVPRRGWLRLSFLGLLAACALVYVYYYSSGTPNSHLLKDKPQEAARGTGAERRAERQSEVQDDGPGQSVPAHQCRAIMAPKTDVNTVDQFPKFEFQPAWMRGKEFWDTNFEKRYLKRRAKWKKLPLKVSSCGV
ncbi:alpha-mannosidase 2 [Cherax quadricarinatus]